MISLLKLIIKVLFQVIQTGLRGWSYLSVAEVLSTDNDKNSIIAQELKLHGNYPNPFNPSTKINFELSGYHDNVTFTVFNVMGQIVNEISFSNTLPGMQVINWNGINSNGASVPSGIYFYQVQAGDLSAMGKMTLVKIIMCPPHIKSS